MSQKRIGVWLVGAFGGVGTTVALGVAALRSNLIPDNALVTAQPLFQDLELCSPDQLVIGGHDIRQTDFQLTVRDFQKRSNVFEPEIVEPCLPVLQEWSNNVKPGTVYNAGPTISRLADTTCIVPANTAAEAIQIIQNDLQDFQKQNDLEQVILVHVASTETPFHLTDPHQDYAQLEPLLSKRNEPPLLPASSLYALAAIDLGYAYVNFTPSLGASFPAALQLAEERKTVIAGQDGKTGETLLKTVLAPMFAYRNLKVLSWVGHNIFGNRDGLVLNDPQNKESKVKTKDQVITQILGYKPQSHVSIEYIESLDDWKTAWDHIHFQGFLGVKMMMQFTWQGCDSVLAAPLVIDLVRLAAFAQRRGEVGVLSHLACFFKNPMMVEEHDFFKQYQMLVDYVQQLDSDHFHEIDS